MTQPAGSTWKDDDVARRFLDERRRAIPLGGEQVAILLRLARRFAPQAARVADLGCGDGFLARAVLSEFPAAHATRIDHSEPMLRRAHEAMAPSSGRFEIRRVFVTLGGGLSRLIWGGQPLAWSPGGYSGRRPRPANEVVMVLTPRSTVAAIRAGYSPQVHPSAKSRWSP